MDASTVYTLIIKLASSGGTIYAVAASMACLLLTAILGLKFYNVNKRDKAITDAKTDLQQACNDGDPNALRDSIKRLRDLQN